ncbi:hypothetical protein BKI52_16195 [marine bacterium AO1-C]|nr:hypothetical protein BKI52_16195 [marine bacterium AO1-C]
MIGMMTVFLLSCNPKATGTRTVNEGNDPNFKITANNDRILKRLPKKVEVFGVPIYAASKVKDERLLHAANIMAQYLDNDEDGQVDNPKVLAAMKSKKAFLIMWKTEADFPTIPPLGRIGQDLGNDETIPAWHTNGQTGRFDAALEEVLHLITHAGYAKAYPKVFGERSDSEIAKAMDIARGGHFNRVPTQYPKDAWYTYDDKTCKYKCMVTEYHYWALTSILGAQAKRLDEIGHEWRLNTRAKVKARDAKIYALLTDPQYKFPRKLPDGTYKR